MLRPFISHAVAQQLIVLVMMNITLVLYNLLITAFSYLVYRSIMPRQGNRSTQGQRPTWFCSEIGDAEPSISCSKKQKTSPLSTNIVNGSAMSMDVVNSSRGSEAFVVGSRRSTDIVADGSRRSESILVKARPSADIVNGSRPTINDVD